jgi:hypothetical protein
VVWKLQSTEVGLDAIVEQRELLCVAALIQVAIGIPSGYCLHFDRGGDRLSSICMADDFSWRSPLPPPRQRLGAIHRKLYRLGHHRQHPHAHTQNRKILLCLNNFRIGL